MQIFAGWVLTLVFTSLFCAGVTSLAVYAPNKPGVYDNVYVAGQLDSLTTAIVREINGTNRGLTSPNATLTRVLGVSFPPEIQSSSSCIHSTISKEFRIHAPPFQKVPAPSPGLYVKYWHHVR